VIPGTGSDEDAAYEPARTVVAIGRTSVRVVVVVAPRADWSGIVIAVAIPGTNPNAYSDLGVRRSGEESRWNKNCAKQQEIS
jgi:hypothetical protein